jgi:DNA invertase Pin-like site-specific DNA recombinase
MTGQRIGYVRVSSLGQNTDRQLEGIQLDRTFTHKVTDKDTNRPKLQEMLEFARDGDTVVVHSMDRLARNLDDPGVRSNCSSRKEWRSSSSTSA